MPRAFVLPPMVVDLMKLWESYQVELQGHYSVERLVEFARYSERTSLIHAAAVSILTIVPPMIAIILADVLPLNPPIGGLRGQNAAYWIRTFYSVLVISVTSIVQFHSATSRLPLKWSWLLTATVVITSASVLFIFALHMIVGFPTPFLYQFTSGFWQFWLFSSMWTMWKKNFREDTEAWKDMKRFIWLWLAQVAMIVVYPVLGYVFRVISSNQKILVTMLLPFWKMALKLWTNYGAFRIEDTTPVFVVFTVDVFHALFLSSAMQSSTNSGYGTLMVVVFVDISQSILAVFDVRTVLGRIRDQARAIDRLEAKAAAALADSPDNGGSPSVQLVGLQSTSWAKQSAMYRAVAILEAHQQIREHPEVCYPRYKHVMPGAGSTNSTRSATYSQTNAKSPAKVHVAASHTHTNEEDTPSRRKSTFATDMLSDLDYARLRFVRETMQLLHMVEFYMLIEFTEVLITLAYSLYLVVMSQLPNRVFYAQLETITDEEWGSTVQYVMGYSCYEFLSYVVLGVALRVMTKMSPATQVAFTLEKHWRLVQSLLVLWVFFVIQMSLKHLGSDYTFKFAWLKKDSPL